MILGTLGVNCRKCGADHWQYMKWKNKDGKRCVKCANRLAKRWKLANPIKRKEACWKYRGINITQEGYNNMYKNQKGQCAVCAVPKPQLQVDHDHTTGRIRGLLCHRCNALAQDVNTVEKILSYMKGGE